MSSGATRHPLLSSTTSGMPVTGPARGLDREMCTLLRYEATEPDQVLTTRTDRPRSEVHTVRHDRHRTGRGVFPGRRGVSADRDERARAPTRSRHRRFEPRRRRRVQGAEQRGAQTAGHRDRQVVQAVVVHDVEGIGGRTGEIEHQRQVGMVVTEEAVRRRHRHVAAGEFTELERRDFEERSRKFRIGSRGGEERHLVAVLAERVGEMPHVRFESSGEGLADRVPVRRDECDAQRRHVPLRPFIARR